MLKVWRHWGKKAGRKVAATIKRLKP